LPDRCDDGASFIGGIKTFTIEEKIILPRQAAG